MLGETGRKVMGPIRGSGDFLAYGSSSISAIQPLWEVVKRGNVVFLAVLVILDIRGRFLSLKAIIFTTW